jgi:hypothetical protein
MASGITGVSSGSRRFQDDAIRRLSQALGCRDEVVGTADRPGIASERVSDASRTANHALQHAGKALLVRAKSYEHGAVINHCSVRHVASKYLSELILVGTGHVRVRWLVLKFDTVPLLTSDNQLLACVIKRLPLRCVVRPLLQQEDGSSRAEVSFRNERDLRRIDQTWILTPIDETRKVAIMTIGPTRGLVRNRRQPFQLGDSPGVKRQRLRHRRCPKAIARHRAGWRASHSHQSQPDSH